MAASGDGGGGPRVGIDLGGTKIEAVRLAADGGIAMRRRVPTPRGDYEGTIAAIAALVAEMEAGEPRPARVGLGFPGSISPRSGLQRNSNSTWLNGRPFLADLAAALGREVRAENDANCFALSEATDGAAADARCVFGVILGTGVGGGVVMERRLWRGRNGIAGEWGHMPLPVRGERLRQEPPRACYCGRLDCLEQWVSGPAIEREHRDRTGRDWRVPAIAEAAAAGDAEAAAAIDRLVHRLACGLAAVCDLLDPDAIVLGGGVGSLAALEARLPDAIAAEVFSDTFDTRVVRPRHGDSSGVRGAAWLW